MKICAVTMVYRDHWALSQWYAHYAAMLGPEHLYIVAHGPDPEIAQLCPGASILTIPRDDVSGFERQRIKFLHGLQLGFRHLYDWVIRTDADELICLDRELYGSLHDMIERHHDAPSLFALGLDLVEQADDPPIHGTEPVFEKRRMVRPYGHYSKAFATRGTLALGWHGVIMRGDKVADYPFVLPKGIYMVHLKYANAHALEVANEHRVEVASVSGVGKNWLKAPERAQRYFRECRALPLTEFDPLVVRVRDETLATVKRDAERGIVRARSSKFDHLARLPDRVCMPA